jgi:hypothetical protein
MSNRDQEYAEFFAATWPRLYRTMYAVAGDHSRAEEALGSAFAQAYVDWQEISTAADPEVEVGDLAVHLLLSRHHWRGARADAAASETAVFGPLTPGGWLIRANDEDRAGAERWWAGFQQLEPAQRAAFALEASAVSRSSGNQSVGWPAATQTGVARERFTEFLVAALPELAVPAGDVDRALARARRSQRRGRLIAAVVSAAMLSLIAAAVVLIDRVDREEPSLKAGRWREVASAPLSPRWSAWAAWTGKEAIFAGGFNQASCEPNGYCVALRDGAAYNPQTDTWRAIAAAPFAVSGYQRAVPLGDAFLVQAERRWWRYDVVGDEWSQITDPPVSLEKASVTSLGQLMYVVGPKPDDPVWIFDGETGQWHTLPPSPFAPPLERRQLVATPVGLVALGADAKAPPGDPFISELYAEVFDSAAWRRLPRSNQKTAPCCWTWSGERLLHSERLAVVGGTQGARGVRFSGGLHLDPASGEWGYLMEKPLTQRSDDTWQIWAASGPMIAGDGLVYDDRDRTWTRLTRPAQAPADEVAAVWAGGQLIAFGGENLPGGVDENAEGTNRAWVYTPGQP